jgi:hypothetical protein
MMRYLAASCALAGAALVATDASAALTATWVRNTITAAAIGADASLANMQSWSLRATNTDGHWASAGLRAQLPAGNAFYNTLPTRGGGDTHPNPAFFPVFPDLEFDTYVSSARNQAGANAPAILGAFPENDPPQSFGGPTDPVPGRFSVAWGDPQATSGPGPGTYEVVRLTFPTAVNPGDIVVNINNVGQGGNWSRTSQVTPDSTIEIPDIPEPASLGLVAAAGLLALRRRK